MPVIIVGGILVGFFTPTEAGAVAVLYAIAVGIYYKELTFEKFKRSILNAAAMTAMCTPNYIGSNYFIMDYRIYSFA